MTVTLARLGFRRIGSRRQLKFALEKYWPSEIAAAELQETAAASRIAAWVNTDSRLKTRLRDEVKPAIEAMVAASCALPADQQVEA